MVRNGSVPHDVLHQLVQEGGTLGRGEVDLKKQARCPDLSISSDSSQIPPIQMEQIAKTCANSTATYGSNAPFPLQSLRTV